MCVSISFFSWCGEGGGCYLGAVDWKETEGLKSSRLSLDGTQGLSRSVALQRQPERVTQKLSKNDIYA